MAAPVFTKQMFAPGHPARIAKYALLVLNVAIYAASMPMDAFHARATHVGWQLAILGVIGFMLDGGWPWLANPLFLLSCLCLVTPLEFLALIPATLAFAFALGFLTVDEFIINEAGHTSRIGSLYAGYWVWLSAMALSAALAWAGSLGWLWQLARHALDARRPTT